MAITSLNRRSCNIRKREGDGLVGVNKTSHQDASILYHTSYNKSSSVTLTDMMACKFFYFPKIKALISAQLSTVYRVPDSPFQQAELSSMQFFCFTTKPGNNGTKETPK